MSETKRAEAKPGEAAEEAPKNGAAETAPAEEAEAEADAPDSAADSPLVDGEIPQPSRQKIHGGSPRSLATTVMSALHNAMFSLRFGPHRSPSGDERRCHAPRPTLPRTRPIITFLS